MSFLFRNLHDFLHIPHALQPDTNQENEERKDKLVHTLIHLLNQAEEKKEGLLESEILDLRMSEKLVSANIGAN